MRTNCAKNKMAKEPSIISNLSTSIIHNFYVSHDSSWQENRAKCDYTFWCVCRGNIYIHTNGKDYHVQPKDTVLFYPGRIYHAHTDKDGCEFLAIRFKLEMGNNMDILHDINVAGIATGLVENTEKFYQDFAIRPSVLGQYSLNQYCIFTNYINKFIERQNRNDAILFYDMAECQKLSTIQAAIDYISANFRTATVKQAAEVCCLSEKRFISNFKHNVGLAPGQYIVQCKMQAAARMLCDTDKKIAEISAYLGYSDQYSFSRAFKRYYGDAPGTFRKNVIL